MPSVCSKSASLHAQQQQRLVYVQSMKHSYVKRKLVLFHLPVYNPAVNSNEHLFFFDHSILVDLASLLLTVFIIKDRHDIYQH